MRDLLEPGDMLIAVIAGSFIAAMVIDVCDDDDRMCDVMHFNTHVGYGVGRRTRWAATWRAYGFEVLMAGDGDQ